MCVNHQTFPFPGGREEVFSAVWSQAIDIRASQAVRPLVSTAAAPPSRIYIRCSPPSRSRECGGRLPEQAAGGGGSTTCGCGCSCGAARLNRASQVGAAGQKPVYMPADAGSTLFFFTPAPAGCHSDSGSLVRQLTSGKLFSTACIHLSTQGYMLQHAW